MDVPTHLVVNSPHKGSVLGRVVAGDSSLEILLTIHREMVLAAALAETRAELASLRAKHPHHGKQGATNKTPALGALKSLWCENCQNYFHQEHKLPGQPSKCVSTLNHVKLIKECFAHQVSELEEGRTLKRHAALFWKFLVSYEFPKLCDHKGRERAAECLVAIIPQDDLASLIHSAEERLLMRPVSIPKAFEPLCSVEQPRATKRHYVRHGVGELSFVRKQHLKLAMEER